MTIPKPTKLTCTSCKLTKTTVFYRKHSPEPICRACYMKLRENKRRPRVYTGMWE